MGSIRMRSTVWLVAAVATCGCGAPAPHGDKPWCVTRVAVRNGSDPVTQAEAVLVADESSGGVDAGGPLDTDGIVEIPVLPGKYTVVVRPLAPAQEEEDQGAEGRRQTPAASAIPRRFQAAGTSPYRVEVIQGTKPVLTIDLAAPCR